MKGSGPNLVYSTKEPHDIENMLQERASVVVPMIIIKDGSSTPLGLVRLHYNTMYKLTVVTRQLLKKAAYRVLDGYT